MIARYSDSAGRRFLMEDFRPAGGLRAVLRERRDRLDPTALTTFTAYAEGLVDPRPLVAATVALDRVGSVLAGDRPAEAGPGLKVHIDPRRATDVVRFPGPG